MGLNSIQNNAILIKRRVPTPKWMLLVGFQVLTNLRLFCVQTGALVEDSCFKKNIQGATANGINVGVYFFTQATTEAEAVEEASKL